MLSSDNIGIKASRIRGSLWVTQSEGYNTLFSRAESEEGYRLYVLSCIACQCPPVSSAFVTAVGM